MPHIKQKKIAVVCNYQIKPDRIGGMDRFFVAFNSEAKTKGYTVNWFFANSEMFEFYQNLTIYSSSNESMESCFLNHLAKEKINYDVVITHFLELCTSFYKNVKKQLSNVHVIAVDHNPRPFEGYSMSEKIKNQIKGLLYSKHIDTFVGVSKYTKKHILIDYGAFLDNKTKVIYNGIDTNIFNKRDSVNQGRFIVASHLRESKGIQDLIKAVSLLDKRFLKDLQIDIFGEGPLESFLKQQVKLEGLSNNIFFKGSSSQLNLLFSNYAYMIQPTYMECFSLSILESLASNVPVVTTEVGGNLELVKDGYNGFVFHAGNVKELASIIKAILTKEKTINHNVSTIIEKEFYLEKMVEEHLNILTCI